MTSARAKPYKIFQAQRCGARLDCEPNAAAFQHSLTVGETVAVFSLADSGPIIEGTGIIESVGPAPYRYYVRFIGEPLARLRFVNPDWQACPARSLALLREFWLSTCASNPCIEDFFPDISATAEE